jgi:phosphatidylinositol-3-phosphatase
MGASQLVEADVPIAKAPRWQLVAAAVLPLILAACMSTGGRPATGSGPASGTGTSSGTSTSSGTGTSSPAGHGGPAAIRHVWVIELENEGSTQSFGTPSADPYLATTLPHMGALLENYYAIGHNSADNYIAEISGQAPDMATQNDCPVWIPFAGHVVVGPYHQVLGQGCVYPAAVQTLGNQLSSAGLSWTAYLQDMGNDPARDKTASTARGPACGHPATGAIDQTESAEQADQYAARHEGFMFFRSVTGNQAFCDAHILSSSRYRLIWRRPAQPQRSPGSRRTSATTATTHHASAVPREGWPRPTRSCRSGCRRSWPRQRTGMAASS